MSNAYVRPVSNLTLPVKDWSRQMADKAVRPKWNGAALTKHREKRGWDVKQFAAILGVAKSQVYKWENDDDGMPKADWFAAILIVFDVPFLRFFTGIDEFQKRLGVQALGAKQEIPMLVGGQDLGATFYSTDVGGATAPHVGALKPEVKSPAVVAKPTSESKHGRPKRKRRP